MIWGLGYGESENERIFSPALAPETGSYSLPIIEHRSLLKFRSEPEPERSADADLGSAQSLESVDSNLRSRGICAQRLTASVNG